MHDRPTPSTRISPDVLDLAKALSRLDGDRDFLKELFALFLEDGPARGQTLAQALASGDMPVAAKAAHSLKGMAGTISAPTLMELAYAMESAAKQTGIAACAELQPRLQAALEAVLAAIRDFNAEN